jgi:hypothetical protein
MMFYSEIALKQNDRFSRCTIAAPRAYEHEELLIVSACSVDLLPGEG